MKQNGTQTVRFPYTEDQRLLLWEDCVCTNDLRIEMDAHLWKNADTYGSVQNFTKAHRKKRKTTFSTRLLSRAVANAGIDAWELLDRSLESMLLQQRDLYSFYAFQEPTDAWADESPSYRANPSAWSKTQCHYANQLLCRTASIVALNNHRVLKPTTPAETDWRRQRQVEQWLINKFRQMRLQFHPTAVRSVTYDSSQYQFTKEGLRITLGINQVVCLPIFHKYTGNLRIVFVTPDIIELHAGYQRTVEAPREYTCREDIYGTDWNIQAFKMLVGEDGACFGNTDPIIKKKIALAKSQERKGRLRKKAKVCAKTNPAKAKRIIQENLGTKNFDKRQARIESTERIEAQTALHNVARYMVANDKCTNAHEKLNFKATKNRTRSFKQRVSLNAYGKMNTYREYIFPLYRIQPVPVNPAYTSRTVPSKENPRQLSLAQRQGDVVRLGADTYDSATLAGGNIGDRLWDHDVTLEMSKEEVRAYLLSKSPTKVGEIGGLTPAKELNPDSVTGLQPGRNVVVEQVKTQASPGEQAKTHV